MDRWDGEKKGDGGGGKRDDERGEDRPTHAEAKCSQLQFRGLYFWRRGCYDRQWLSAGAAGEQRVGGAALHAACADIPTDGFLHPMIQGILLAETSGLTPTEFASVIGTSGKTGAEGEKIGNS